jgi:hypothetical protein
MNPNTTNGAGVRYWGLIVFTALACAPARTKPDPLVCPGDVRWVVQNQLSQPIDVNVGGSIVGTIQPGGQGTFKLGPGEVPRGVPSASATSRFGFSQADRKRIVVRYQCESN